MGRLEANRDNSYWAEWEDWKQIGTILIGLSGKIGSKSGLINSLQPKSSYLWYTDVHDTIPVKRESDSLEVSLLLQSSITQCKLTEKCTIKSYHYIRKHIYCLYLLS